MTKRPLARTRFRASIIGIGDLADRAVPLDTCVATLRRAVDFGLNAVGTAPGYEDGYSEQIVGGALKGKGRRDGVFVIDKIGHLDQPVGPQVDMNLTTLGMEAVDLFVFHAVSERSQWERIAAVGMEEVARCQAAGKVRFRGISSHHPDVLRAALTSGLCDVVMFPVGPFVDRRYVDEILPLARQQGVGTVCFKTFGAGKLLGDTTGYSQPLQPRPRGKFSSGGQTPRGGAAAPTSERGRLPPLHTDAEPRRRAAGHEFPERARRRAPGASRVSNTGRGADGRHPSAGGEGGGRQRARLVESGKRLKTPVHIVAPSAEVADGIWTRGECRQAGIFSPSVSK
jgi:1-deoxyxylulose-5-phosphate synthase